MPLIVANNDTEQLATFFIAVLKNNEQNTEMRGVVLSLYRRHCNTNI